MDSQKKVAIPSKRIMVGPWGGQGEAPWDDGSYTSIRSIILVYGHCIDSIRFEYDNNGKPVLAERHGGSGGSRTLQIKFAYPEEYLTAVSGYIDPVVHGGSPVISSLRFKSNKQTLGPYGTEKGTPFDIPIEGGIVVGFYGRSGRYLDSIGMYLSRINTAYVSRIHAANIYDSVHQKIHKLGSAAYRKLGNKDGKHRYNAKAKTNKGYA